MRKSNSFNFPTAQAFQQKVSYPPQPVSGNWEKSSGVGKNVICEYERHGPERVTYGPTYIREYTVDSGVKETPLPDDLVDGFGLESQGGKTNSGLSIGSQTHGKEKAKVSFVSPVKSDAGANKAENVVGGQAGPSEVKIEKNIEAVVPPMEKSEPEPTTPVKIQNEVAPLAQKPVDELATEEAMRSLVQSHLNLNGSKSNPSRGSEALSSKGRSRFMAEFGDYLPRPKKYSEKTQNFLQGLRSSTRMKDIQSSMASVPKFGNDSGLARSMVSSKSSVLDLAISQLMMSEAFSKRIQEKYSSDYKLGMSMPPQGQVSGLERSNSPPMRGMWDVTLGTDWSFTMDWRRRLLGGSSEFPGASKLHSYNTTLAELKHLLNLRGKTGGLAERNTHQLGLGGRDIKLG